MRARRSIGIRKAAGASIVLLLVLGVGGCDDPAGPPARPEAAADEPAPARRAFTLAGASLALPLPEAAVVREQAGGQAVTVDLAKGRRLERLLVVSSVARAPGAGYDRRMVLSNGGGLDYRVDDDTGGGSGGPVAELTGRLEMGSLVLWVTCTDQSEWTRQPDWCLPYIRDLEILARTP